VTAKTRSIRKLLVTSREPREPENWNLVWLYIFLLLHRLFIFNFSSHTAITHFIIHHHHHIHHQPSSS
jgi:hypothetical protein